MRISIEDKENDRYVTVERKQQDPTLWVILNRLIIPALNGMGYTTEEIDEELDKHVSQRCKEKPMVEVKK